MISVVIPVYNVEPYLAECLDSIINQTYTDLEIIVVNDGSTDGSGAICDAYAKKDSRIRVIHQKNQGSSVARNQGLDISKGEYIAFVDGDDCLLPDTLESQLNLCQKNKADYGIFSYCFLMESGKIQDHILANPVKGIELYTGREKMEVYLRTHKVANAVWAKLYSRDLFNELRFPVGKVSQDAFITYKLVHKAKRIAISEKVGYVYRKRPNSIMTRPCIASNFDVIDALLEEKAFVTEYYPDLVDNTNIKLCQTALTLTIRASLSNFSDRVIDRKVQTVFRKHLPFFLKASHNRKKKLLAILSAFNLKLTRASIRTLRRFRPNAFSRINELS